MDFRLKDGLATLRNHIDWNTKSHFAKDLFFIIVDSEN